MSKIESVALLKKEFPLADHFIREGGYGKWFVYIKREAIIDRLDSIAPMAWSNDVTNINRHEHTVTVTVSITMFDITRTYNGSADDKPIKDKKTKEIIGWYTENTEKAAVTDGFKRAASLWGIGLYLQQAPDINSSSENEGKRQFAGWYRTQFDDNGEIEAPPEPEAPQQEPEEVSGYVVSHRRYVVDGTVKYLEFTTNPDNDFVPVVRGYGRSTRIKGMLNKADPLLYGEMKLAGYSRATETTDWQPLTRQLVLSYTNAGEYNTVTGIDLADLEL